jgi:hypothetical protein
VWELHLLCKAYQQRPSRVIGLRNGWLAWSFDNAVSLYGRFVEAELSRTDKDGKPIRTLNDILKNGSSRRQGTLEELIAILGEG